MNLSAQQLQQLGDAVTGLLAATVNALLGLEQVGRRYHPPLAPQLVERLAPNVSPLEQATEHFRRMPWPGGGAVSAELLQRAADRTLEALREFEQAGEDPGAPAALTHAYRAMGMRCDAYRDLYPLASDFSPLHEFFLEPALRGTAIARRIPRPTFDDTEGTQPVGLIEAASHRGLRGGWSLYVPEVTRQEEGPWPLVIALHGGSGHGSRFLWSWLRAARSRGCLLLAPTSLDNTWSLLQPPLDATLIADAVREVRERWSVDPDRVLLTGMSDGATYSLLAGTSGQLPCTHLAPISGTMPPLPRSHVERLRELPVYLVHGSLDWMFPVEMAQVAAEELRHACRDLVWRELSDLSHTYPEEENGRILEWMDPALALPEVETDEDGRESGEPAAGVGGVDDAN